MNRKIVMLFLIAFLSFSPDMQVSCSDDYIQNGGFEEPVISDPWTIPGWGDGGRIGVGSPSYMGKGVRLYQWSLRHASEIWQEVNLDKKNLVLSFWFKPSPEGSWINFQVLFDGYVIFNNTYTGSNNEYYWINVLISLEPIFEKYGLETGVHEIRFHVSPGVDFIRDPMPCISIDEVSIISAEVLNRHPILSLEPSSIEIPKLENGAIILGLKINNVFNLKSYSFELHYDRNVLEFIGGKMDDSFLTLVGEYEGGIFQGTLSKSFSGSARMFIYAFRIRDTGFKAVKTEVRIVSSELLTSTEYWINYHNYSGCTINILSREEWMDDEYSRLIIEYDMLLANYTEIKNEYDNYRTTHSHTNMEFNNIQSQRDQYIQAYENLALEYNLLNATYNQYKKTHFHSNDEYNNLMSKYESIRNQVSSLYNVVYVLMITTGVFLATTIYFAKKKTS